MPTNYITLPRSKLYELVWTKPVTELAKEFGISDVALAKRCRALNIPVPPRGHWARVAAGQSPKRPRLPPFGTSSPAKRTAGAPAARESRPAASSSSLPSYVSTHDAGGILPEPTVAFDPSRAADKVREDLEPLPELTTPPTTDLASTLPIVRRTARHYKHPLRSELEFPRGEGTGPILRLNVSDSELERALLIIDRFLRACAEQGWNPIPPKEPERPDPRHYYGRPPEPPKKTGPDFADLDVAGHRIEFAVEERYEQRELPPTERELARQKRDTWFRPEKRYETIWSGRLRLKRPSYRYPYGIDGKSWFETANRKLDELIPRILADFRTVATRMQEKDDELERERLERARQEKLRQERAERRAANLELIKELEGQAGAWHRAEYLRHYLRAARRAVAGTTLTTERQGETIDYLAWAEHYVNQLDPLHPEPRDPDLQRERNFYYGAEEKYLNEELQRLLGHAWERSVKLPPPEQSTPPSTPD